MSMLQFAAGLAVVGAILLISAVFIGKSATAYYAFWGVVMLSGVVGLLLGRVSARGARCE